MTERNLQRRQLFMTAAAAAILARPRAAAAQARWEKLPETRPIADVVPPALQRGPHFSLGPTVTTFSFMNRTTMTSDFGAFDAPGDAMLRRLVREIAAIASLRDVQQTAAFTQAALEAGRSSVRSAQNLVTDPVGTLSAVPAGIGSIFNRIGERAQRSNRSDFEDDSTRELLAVSAFKRETAARLGVDVYSSNEILQRELNRVSWASALGNLSIGALSLATGAVVFQVASNVRMLEQVRNLVESTPPSELSRRNRAELQRLEVPNAGIDSFLNNRRLSPRHQTVIVSGLMAMGRLPGQSAFVARAASAGNEEQALLYQQMAELMAGYHLLVSPLREIRMTEGLPVALTRGGAVLLLPIDRLLWMEEYGQRATRLAQALRRSGATNEVWITGSASAAAAAGLRQLGFGFTPECGTRLPMLD